MGFDYTVTALERVIKQLWTIVYENVQKKERKTFCVPG